MLPAMFRTSDDPQPYWTDRPPRGQAPVPWAGPLPVEPNVPAGELSAGIADRDAICPFLLAADLSWRAATPQREHRCTAVTPRQPVALEVQRELCLVEAHRICDRFVAATRPRSQRSDRHRRPDWRHRRPLARTMPLLIERGNVHNPLPPIAIRSSVMQAVVVALLVAALAMIVAARVLPAVPAAQSSPTPIQSVAAILLPSPTGPPTIAPGLFASP